LPIWQECSSIWRHRGQPRCRASEPTPFKTGSKAKPIAIFLDHTRAPSLVEIIDYECHPTEDVAVLKLADSEWGSIHDLSPTRQFGSAEVMMWAYPENVAKEHQNAVPPDDPEATTVRPDLIYFQGYIRRRIDREFPVGILRGSAFSEEPVARLLAYG